MKECKDAHEWYHTMCNQDFDVIVRRNVVYTTSYEPIAILKTK